MDDGTERSEGKEVSANWRVRVQIQGGDRGSMHAFESLVAALYARSRGARERAESPPRALSHSPRSIMTPQKTRGQQFPYTLVRAD